MKVLSIYRILKKIIVRSREMTVAKTLAEKKNKIILIRTLKDVKEERFYHAFIIAFITYQNCVQSGMIQHALGLFKTGSPIARIRSI